MMRGGSWEEKIYDDLIIIWEYSKLKKIIYKDYIELHDLDVFVFLV